MSAAAKWALAVMIAISIYLMSSAYHVFAVNHNLKIVAEELTYLHAEVAKLKQQNLNQKPCTTEQAVQWWTSTTNTADARKKICGK